MRVRVCHLFAVSSLASLLALVGCTAGDLEDEDLGRAGALGPDLVLEAEPEDLDAVPQNKSYHTLQCRGDDDMEVRLRGNMYQGIFEFVMEIVPGKAKFGWGSQAPGECRWIDRAFTWDEPKHLCHSVAFAEMIMEGSHREILALGASYLEFNGSPSGTLLDDSAYFTFSVYNDMFADCLRIGAVISG